MKTSLFRARPHLWYQLYWVVYLIWFFWLDLTVTDPKYIIHSPLDDFIPFKRVVHLSLRQLVLPAGGRHGAALVVRHCQLRQAVPHDVLRHDLLSHPLYGAAQRP